MTANVYGNNGRNIDIKLVVDGVDQPTVIFYDPVAVSGGTAIDGYVDTSQVNLVSLSSGSHTIKMMARISSTGGNIANPSWYGIVAAA